MCCALYIDGNEVGARMRKDSSNKHICARKVKFVVSTIISMGVSIEFKVVVISCDIMPLCCYCLCVCAGCVFLTSCACKTICLSACMYACCPDACMQVFTIVVCSYTHVCMQLSVCINILLFVYVL